MQEVCFEMRGILQRNRDKNQVAVIPIGAAVTWSAYMSLKWRVLEATLKDGCQKETILFNRERRKSETE